MRLFITLVAFALLTPSASAKPRHETRSYAAPIIMSLPTVGGDMTWTFTGDRESMVRSLGN